MLKLVVISFLIMLLRYNLLFPYANIISFVTIVKNTLYPECYCTIVLLEKWLMSSL